MSTRPIDHILARPPRPTPWMLWPIAAVLALILGNAIPSKSQLVLVLGGSVFLWGLLQTLKRPIFGFYLSLAFFPFYTLCRGLVMYFKIPIPLSLAGMWPEMVLSIMGACVIIGCIRHGHRLRFTWNDLPVGLLVASGVYGLIVSLAQGAALGGLYGFHSTVTPLLFYVIARWLRPTDADMRRIFGFWLISYTLLAVLSLLDYVFRPKFVIELAILLRDGFWTFWDPHVFFAWYPRMQSLMFSEQYWGTICAMVSVFCLSVFSIKPLPRWCVPLLILSLLCMALSMSRGALIDWGVAVVVLFCFRGKHRTLIVVCLAMILAATLALSVISEKRNDKIATLITRFSGLAAKSEDSGSGPEGEGKKEEWQKDRVTQWQYAINNFPLFPAGRGLGRAGGQALFHDTGDGSIAIADGGFFKILAEAGLPGVLIFLTGCAIGILIYLRLLGYMQNSRNTYDYALGRFTIAVLCGLLVHNIGANIFDAFFVQPLYWMLAGLFVARAEMYAARQLSPPIGRARVDIDTTMAIGSDTTPALPVPASPPLDRRENQHPESDSSPERTP